MFGTLKNSEKNNLGGVRAFIREEKNLLKIAYLMLNFFEF